jgi:hypothetical protein
MEFFGKSKQPPRSGGPQPPRSRAAPRAAQGAPPRAGPEIPSGRVRHDDRGNAIWDWVKDTGRHALDSTSRLLKKLEMPQLEVEDTHDEELRIEKDRNPGSGYDPYNQASQPKKPPRRD